MISGCTQVHLEVHSSSETHWQVCIVVFWTLSIFFKFARGKADNIMRQTSRYSPCDGEGSEGCALSIAADGRHATLTRSCEKKNKALRGI